MTRQPFIEASSKRIYLTTNVNTTQMRFVLLKTTAGLKAVNVEKIVLVKHDGKQIQLQMTDGISVNVEATDLPAFIDMLNRQERNEE